MPAAFTTPPDLTRDIDQLRREHALPGLAWAVAPLDGPLIAGASGVRRLDRPYQLTVHDRLHLGSCTKPMTATLLATLIPDVLQWNTRITEIFPAHGVHPAYHDITLAHLLSHHAGLPPFDEDQHFRPAPPRRGRSVRQRDAFVRWALQQPPAFPPGTYGYSNAGYSVAAVMAEQRAARTWEDLMHQRVFTPLELDSAGFGWPARRDAEQPWGHRWRRHAWAPHYPNGRYHLHPGISPAGDAHLHILDFAEFARAHLRGLNGDAQLLEAPVFTQLHTPFVSDGQSGLGWGVSRYRDQRASSHSGSADTFLALLLVLPDEGHAFVVVTNAAGGNADAATRAVLAHLVAHFTSARVAA